MATYGLLAAALSLYTQGNCSRLPIDNTCSGRKVPVWEQYIFQIVLPISVYVFRNRKCRPLASVGLWVSGSHYIADIAAICSHATCEIEQSGGAILIWVSHQQMAPQSNSSLRSQSISFPSHRLEAVHSLVHSSSHLTTHRRLHLVTSPRTNGCRYQRYQGPQGTYHWLYT